MQSFPPCSVQRSSCQAAQCEQRHCTERSWQKPCKRLRAPGFKGKEVREERDHIEGETLWLLSKKKLPLTAQSLWLNQGWLLVLLHVQWDLSHPMYFGKSNIPGAISQQERARGSDPEPIPGVLCQQAGCQQPSSKFRTCSVPFPAHKSCWCPGQQDAPEKGQESINQHWILATLAESALLSAAFFRKLKYYSTSDHSPFALEP